MNLSIAISCANRANLRDLLSELDGALPGDRSVWALGQLFQQAERDGGLLRVIVKYYGYQSIGFFDRTSGILAMISAMFTVTWLQRHQEMTAMLAAGISKFRIIRPLILAAVVVSLLGVASRELLIPKIRDELTRSTKDLGGTSAQVLEARLDGRTNILVGGEQSIAASEKSSGRRSFCLGRSSNTETSWSPRRRSTWMPPSFIRLAIDAGREHSRTDRPTRRACNSMAARS